MSQRQLCADIFGVQIGTRFEEGLVDSENQELLDARFASLESVWVEKLGHNGKKFHDWFKQYKLADIANHMLKPVRMQAGIGNAQFVTNRVECINQLLKAETGGPLSVSNFAVSAHNLATRQKRNVEWAVIGKS